MNGASQTKELASREIKVINDLVEQWIDAREKQNNSKCIEISDQIQTKFKHNKALISVLRNINDEQSIKLFQVMEAQQQHFSDMLAADNQFNPNEADDQQNFEENIRILENLKETTKEIDKTLNDQINSLESISSLAYENHRIMNLLVPKVRKADKDITELFLLLFIAVLLMFVIMYLYSNH
ncbi:hypothetical protein TVAG_497380 [Trichomonas vaginalis G3]|uniref:Uncharacterized protein n=1 Tax=Trichomonas vaginalis (strain ATCC PRA-98 / G3) TaxID=412133 RepID=A2EGY0_TRIV3|nr:hypothetical protein TVAGG3_0803400 [Trichomonas vaginalis G3]EAY08114.1 hypothetical protein TVAG_497380 [Trichomonas vaginalis G3]KAI5496671.1 hypothetical protein TVAGG3_0803400 [Trichomonas vaginalis G3]|eukprot:XP_001320337.1 hypothetical protein [Trichomonas vaginalis G3]